MSTFATYVFLEEEQRFDPQTAFVAMTLLDIMKNGMIMAPYVCMELITTLVSVKRISKFLNKEDLDVEKISHNPSGNTYGVILAVHVSVSPPKLIKHSC